MDGGYKPIFQRKRAAGRLPSAYPQRREVAVGSVVLGADNPVAIQSMTTTDTSDVEATLAEIRLLEEAGCELIRVSVPDEKSAHALPAIKKQMRVPLIADIHFQPKLALAAIAAGVDKVRLNPGNIVTRDRLEPVARELAKHKMPVRIGVNAGSIAADLKPLYRDDPVAAIVKSAHRYIEMLESLGVHQIVVALKSSDVPVTVEAYRKFAWESDYPLHMGITEAGPGIIGASRSAAGLGLLLAEGLGDTLRVSLASGVEDEVVVAKEILSSLGIREFPRLIACPTCARQEFDVIATAGRLQRTLLSLKVPLTVAIMGCVVNGPGEAAEADVGLIASGGSFTIYRDGAIAQRANSLAEAEAAFRRQIALAAEAYANKSKMAVRDG